MTEIINTFLKALTSTIIYMGIIIIISDILSNNSDKLYLIFLTELYIYSVLCNIDNKIYTLLWNTSFNT